MPRRRSRTAARSPRAAPRRRSTSTSCSTGSSRSSRHSRPSDTNKFAYEIVQTLQGESGNVENLLARTSSLTNTLAGRDQLIGDVITNLSEVLDTVGSRDKELTDTIDTLQQFVTGLKDDRDAILNSVDSISDLTDETSDLLVQGRPALTEDIKQLNALTKNLSSKKNLVHARELDQDPADQAPEDRQRGVHRRRVQLLPVRRAGQHHASPAIAGVLLPETSRSSWAARAASRSAVTGANSRIGYPGGDQ